MLSEKNDVKVVVRKFVSYYTVINRIIIFLRWMRIWSKSDRIAFTGLKI